MATEENIPPEPHLMESMRAVGYTLEAAIADLIDNSITAGASRIDLAFAAGDDGYLAILDDGRGMTPAVAREAMRLAGRNATDARAGDDLGRFGLGLKTASLSQCRRLTLVTKSAEEGLVAYAWDLDHLMATGRWSLLKLEQDELVGLPLLDRLNAAATGTIILWQKLDQLTAHVGSAPDEFDSAMVSVREHLGLVFHRFLQAPRNPLTITINGRPAPCIDPFLSDHKRTQRLPEQSFTVSGSTITVRPFTVPRPSTLTAKERQDLEAPGLLRDSQGFYIYRARRLVIWGTWFRIQPRQELAKLSRVQVDIPNTLDHLWALDIKKSTAQPPPAVRNRLRVFAEQVTQPSKRTFEFRGRKETDAHRHLWQVVTHDNSFSYTVNRAHPAVEAVRLAAEGRADQEIDRLLALVDGTLPTDDLFNRVAKDQVAETTLDEDALLSTATDLWLALRGSFLSGDPAAEFVAAMSAVEPFFGRSNSTQILQEATRVNV